MRKTFLYIALISLLSLTIISCSSDDSSGSAVADDGGIKYFDVINADKMYTIDDLKMTGMKGIKVFGTDAVDKKTGELLTPGATDIQFGFYKGEFGPKDVEVRFYKSHEDAVNLGQGPADEITEKPSNLIGNSSVSTLADAGVGMKGSTKYGGFLISGNLLILCQTQFEVCEDFLTKLP